jgi:peptidoglycan/xylan/chitin deacetylase (PgdA/CDA1 family)
MQDSGIITFGSHTLTHPYLTKSGPEKLRKEIFDSKKILENKLKRKVNAFSYPYGDFNYKARQLVIEAGYKLAVAADPGKEYPSDDIFALKRLEVPKNARNLLVFWLEISGFYNWADYISSSTAGKLKSYYARFISKR